MTQFHNKNNHLFSELPKNIKMPAHTKTIESILEPVAQQVNIFVFLNLFIFNFHTKNKSAILFKKNVYTKNKKEIYFCICDVMRMFL